MIRYRYQSRAYTLNTFTDADWAGEARERKSTSGGIVNFGDHTLRAWASTQNVIALSSGESEYYGLVKAASVSIGIRSMMADLGVEVRIRLITDATTGIAIASRRGLGKIKHLDVAQLWVQAKVKSKELEVSKIKN